MNFFFYLWNQWKEIFIKKKPLSANKKSSAVLSRSRCSSSTTCASHAILVCLDTIKGLQWRRRVHRSRETHFPFRHQQPLLCNLFTWIYFASNRILITLYKFLMRRIYSDGFHLKVLEKKVMEMYIFDHGT